MLSLRKNGNYISRASPTAAADALMTASAAWLQRR
jgi:hypothetical protein